MKIKRIFAVLLCAALIFSAMPVFGFVADADTTYTTQVVLAEGNGGEGNIYHPGGTGLPSRTFSGTASGWANNLRVATSASTANPGNKDLSSCTDITLKIALSTTTSGYTGASAYNYWLGHMYMLINDDGGHYARFPLPAANGNTVEADFDLSTVPSSFDLSNVTNFIIKTVPASANWRSDGNMNLNVYSDMNNGYTDSSAPSVTLTLSKIYGVVKSHQDTANEKFLSKGAYRFWGKGSGSFAWATFDINLASSVDVSAYDFIEYDLYISDADRLRSETDSSSRAWTSANVRIGTSSSNFYRKADDATNLQSGYNHIRVPVSTISSYASSLSYFMFYLENNNMAYTEGQTWNYVFGVVNIKATKVDTPAVTEGKVIVDSVTALNWQSGSLANTINRSIAPSSPKDLSGYGKIFVDIYVSDAAALKSLANFTSFNMLARTSSQEWSNFYRYEFKNQIVNDGWNHITIDMSDYTQKNGSPDWSTATSFYFYIEGNNTAVADRDYKIVIANICAGRADTFVFYESGSSFSWASGKGRSNAVRDYSLSEAEDLSNADIFEFEYYVNNWNSLKSESDFNGFRILMRSTSDWGTNVYKGDFTLTQSGWNKVRINKTGFGTLGSPSWNSILGFRIYMENSGLVAHTNYTFQIRNFTAIKANAMAYKMFGNDMLFQRNKPVTVNGVGTAGCNVQVKLMDGSSVVASNTGIVGSDDRWSVTLDCSINGGYKTYDLVVSANDFEVHHFTGIVFGELWLAIGQSNMEFKMWETPEGDVYFDTNTFPNGNIHIYSNARTFAVFKDPQETSGGSWILGNVKAAHNVSAVAYWFANTIQQQLNMPVGFLDAPIAGTGIESWIPRDVLENDAELKALMQANGRYTAYEDMDSQTSHTTATSCYNQNVAALEVFNVAGAIWYQGENNVAHTSEFYKKALCTLIDTYSERFGFNGTMPFIITHLAPYGYTGTNLPRMWETQSNVWSQYSSTAAQVPIYDLSLEWAYGDWAAFGTGGNAIHPYTKKPVGERMGAAALGLVYGRNSEYTAPVYSSHTVNGKYVDVTFDHVGDGLAAKDGKALKGFTVAGADGVYVNAKATIINSNTVRVWSDYLSSPVSVAYAFNTFTTNCNLSSRLNGSFFQLAAPFRSSVIPGASYLGNDYWMTADFNSTWLPYITTPDIYEIWSATGALLTIDTTNKYYGDGSLKATFSSGSFSVSPRLLTDDNKNFGDVKYDYSDINTIYFRVKSSVATNITNITFTNGTTPVQLEFMIDGNSNTTSLAPGAWREVAVDLTNADTTLNSVKGITIGFSASGSGTVNIDDFSLSRQVLPIGDQMSVIPDLNNVYNTVDYIPGVQHTIELSAGENAYPSKGYFRLSKTLNTLNAEYIEMDIYATAATDLTPSFWVSNDRESASVRGKYTIPQLNAGWNHIVINAATPISANGSFTFSGYDFAYPFIEGTFYSSSHPTGGTVRIANISVTRNLVAPTDIMSDNTAFMSETLKSVTLSNDGAYDFRFSSTDISDTRMIELDVYVTDNEFDTVTVRVADTDGNYADYEFTDLTTGWNHLAVRITDLTQGNANTKALDLTDVAKFTLLGTAGGEVAVANAYAADYVEGDANRDGVFDIKDIVRAKKMAAGVTTVGNKLAVSGSDYEINALDLTNLIHSIIDTLFT